MGKAIITQADINYEKKYPCPVCCVGLARDRDMVLINGRFVCQSDIFELESSCGFSFPKNYTEAQIRAAAQERIAAIKNAPAHS